MTNMLLWVKADRLLCLLPPHTCDAATWMGSLWVGCAPREACRWGVCTAGRIHSRICARADPHCMRSDLGLSREGKRGGAIRPPNLLPSAPALLQLGLGAVAKDIVGVELGA